MLCSLYYTRHFFLFPTSVEILFSVGDFQVLERLPYFRLNLLPSKFFLLVLFVR